MNCIVIDDENSAIDTLKEMIGRLSYLNFLRGFTNPFEGLEFIQKQKVDLIFMDVEMPAINGIELIRTLINRPQIIFTAIDNQSAISGFELDATDYLLKPVSFDRFFKAVYKANQIQKLFELTGTKSMDPDKSSHLDFLLVKTGYTSIRIDLNDILYCEGLKDYIKIHLPGKSIITQNSLKKFEEILPSDRFVRVHKSFIIQLDKIDSIQNNRISIGKILIPIGDNYKINFSNKISSVNV